MAYISTIKTLKILLPIVIALTGVALCWIVVQSVIAQGPNSQAHHFGVVRAGQRVEHTFIVKNSSFKTLAIHRIRSSCSCTLPQERPSQIPPRSTREIPVILNTTGRSGKVAQRIIVEFEDRDPIFLVMRGEVIKDTPHELAFPRLKADEQYTMEFLLQGYPGEDLRVQRLEYDEQYLDVQYILAEQKNYKFSVQLKKGLPKGPFQKMLTIHTNDSVASTKHIPIHGYIYKEVEARPKKVSFGILSPDQEKTERIVLYSPYGKPVSIDRIESSSQSHIEWKILDSDGKSDSIQIEVSLKTTNEMVSEGIIRDELFIYSRVGETQIRTDIVALAALSKD